MDLAVLIVGAVMGFMACYFTLGPGKDKMNKKADSTKPGKHPVRPAGGARPRRPVWDEDEEGED